MPYYYVPYNNANSIQNVSAVPYPYYQPPMNGGYMYPQVISFLIWNMLIKLVYVRCSSSS